MFLKYLFCSYCKSHWIKASAERDGEVQLKCNGMFWSSELVCDNAPVCLAVLQDAFEYSYPPLPEEDFQPPLSESGQGEGGETGEEAGETEGVGDGLEPRTRKVCN